MVTRTPPRPDVAPTAATPATPQRPPGGSVRDDGTPTPQELEVIDWLLTTTRANRKTLDLTRPVDPDVVTTCLRLALQAPAAHNDQRWHWMVVTDPDKRQAIADAYVRAWEAATRAERRKVRRFRSADQSADRNQDSAHWLPQHLHQVPVFVIPCLVGPRPDEQRVQDEWHRIMAVGGYPEADTLPLTAAYWGTIYPAVWSFQLALRSRGLGSVLTVMHLAAQREIAALLRIPDTAQQTCLLPVAHVTRRVFAPARRAPLETRMSWNSWLGAR